MTRSEEYIKRIIKEELTRQEVRSMINDKMDSFIKEREVKKEIRGIVVDVLGDFFREMWRKEGFWKNPIKNN